MAHYESLVELIEARKNEENVGVTFILSEKEESYVSYKQLYQTSLHLLYTLQQNGFKYGDKVIFQIDDNRKFIYSFWACVLGGMIPVPVATGNNDEHKATLFKIWSILDSPRIIISQENLQSLFKFASENELENQIDSIKERSLSLDENIQTENNGEIYHTKSDDIAFIQFSSGSTGNPKGVMIKHSNVFVNLQAVLDWDHFDSNDSGLSWLPLTHDMGLIGFHIKEVFAGINQYSMPTQLFLAHPILWLQKASEHKATILYSPNFGYKQVLKEFNPEIKRDWDLSSVRVIYNGAEPTSLEVNNDFLDKMSVYGLKRNTMKPAYGLAESTIAVAFPPCGEEFIHHVVDRNHLRLGETVIDTDIADKNSVVFLDVGFAIYNCYLRICDAENKDIGENKIGYIQISGKNVTSGYYNNPQATKEAMTPDGWLNTGDLGFMRNKRLTITGRAKDVIIAAGKNFYSTDIEQIGENVCSEKTGKIAAVGVFNDVLKSDELILFIAHDEGIESFIDIAAKIKRSISQKIGIEVAEIVPITEMIKTSSGKIQRYKLRENYLNGEYSDVISQMHALSSDKYTQREIIQPETPVQKELVKIWSEITERDQIGIRDNFFEMGGDSLKATQMASRIEEIFGIDVDLSQIFATPDIEALAKIIEDKNSQNNTAEITETPYNDDKKELSYAQQRLWFLDRLNSQSPQYNLSRGLVLKGNLNVDALIESFNKIIMHHDVLRAYFIEEDGQPVQKLAQNVKIPLEFLDMQDVPENERLAKVTEIAKNETRIPFDLEKAPLIRGKLITINDNEHILILVIHHIIFDGWSFSVLLKELKYNYVGILNELDLPLPELQIQYADFATRQKQTIKEGKLKNQLEYWKKQLDGNLPVLELPIDKKRPLVQTYNGAIYKSQLSADLVSDLQKYALKENATLFMVLLAAFNLMIYKYTGQTDIILGSPIANRNKKDIEGLIGFFTNDIILRTTFTDDIKFSEMVKCVKQVTLNAYSNQDVPFEKIVEELHVERDMSRNPLFQVLFGMQNTPVADMKFQGIDISQIYIDAGYSRFDLSVDINIMDKGLEADFEFNTDLFNVDTIERMAGHYTKILESIVNSSDLLLGEYEILTNEDKNKLLVDWNNTKEDLPDVSYWTQLFEKQVALTPDAIAVVCGNRQMTYKELNDSSNRLANYLNACDVGPENIVGVYIDRSIEMLIGLLAVHKAGAAYLPMDPIFPKDRLAYMIEDSKVNLILSEKKLRDTLPDNNARIICLDTESDIISGYSSDEIVQKSNDNHLAYVIYTSGSTGKPKGVQIEQRALINVLLSFAKKTELKYNDSLLAVTTLSFDIAGLELYMPLICGAKVVIAERDDVMDGSKLISMLDQHAISIMQATPATWRLMIDSGWKGSSSLKILCGGEALQKDLADQLLTRCAALYNVYGPTETTIWSTVEIIKPDEKVIYVGKPIANTKVYVVDKSMKLVPIGVPGELLIGGDGLARGYLHLPELTNEKFIPDFISKKQGDLLYKTGDIVKFTPEGKLECIGRKDNQVKIRGFRIELGEIEALICAEQYVKQCVVDIKEIISGEKSLVAYIIPDSGKSSKDFNIDAIKKSLKERLPEYMVPSAFMFMDTFPMTPNGKINRKVLPIPERLAQKTSTEVAAPSSEIESKLQAIWKEVLKLEEVDINSNFFDLGGHSLLLAQVRSKIETVLDKKIAILDLFKYTTIATLAKYLSGGSEQEARPEVSKKQNVNNKNNKIAVIGLSGRFPGAKNTDEFWKNLCNGVNSISHFTDEQVLEEGVSPDVLKKPGYVKAWGALEDIDKFDAQFFGYNPREAEVLDPQQRVFLQECWKTVEDAGYNVEKYNGLVGVYASVGMNTYANNLNDGKESKGLANDYQIMISNDKDFLATRIAYKLNLEGPSLTVQTACSSSLVAVHLACQSLINGECDMALAGGVSIRMPQKTGYLYQEGMILSPDGICRAFDDHAQGTVGGNGAGVVMLKRLEDAIADGDDIKAVILGSAINNDGSMKIGYTAPSMDGQSKVIAKAQEAAQIDPETITYVEAHGTGTPLGDPIEIEALTQVFRRKTEKKEYCGIGSVKTNVGHLDSAAGITGLIKTVLSLKNKVIPPSLNFESPNKKINFADSPFYVNKSLTHWSNESSPLRAAVSAFGIGGTNAHVILEEAPQYTSDPVKGKPELITLSAKSKKVLDSMTKNLISFLEANKDISLADIAYTLQLGRKELEFRRFFICSTIDEALEMLKNPDKVFDSNEVKNKGDHQPLSEDIGKYTLEQIGQMWLNGESIDWKGLYKDQKRNRLSLPTYPFDGHSFWVKKVAQKENDHIDVSSKRPEVKDMFYTPVWKQSVDRGNFGIDNDPKKEVVLLIKDSSKFADAFEAKLKEDNTNVIIALSGNEYKSSDAGEYAFNTEDPAHYEQLISELSQNGKVPSRIINMLGIKDGETNMESIQLGRRLLYSMMYLAQAIGKNGITAAIELKVLTNSTQRIFNEQKLNPGNALHLGACRVIPIEYQNIKCCSIDLSLPVAESSEEQELLDLLLNEIYFMPCEGLVAYRGMERWNQGYESIKLEDKNNRSIKLKDDGVYVIVGGMGGIGLEMAKYIASEANGVKLALIAQSKFPEINEWDSWIETHGKRNKTTQKIVQLREIISTGAEISIYQADITEPNEFARTGDMIINNYGKIDGIIHAAGRPGSGMIQAKKKEQAEIVLAPKVQGTINLFETFKDRNLDFMILFSSLNAITGGFGQMDYSAANAFVDAFAQANDKYKGTRVISIDWDRWPGIGMASSTSQASENGMQSVHPLLGKCILDKEDKIIYSNELCPENDWVLSEHRVLGIPTIAGTTYLEMARAAFEDIIGNNSCEISEVLFMSPLAVKYGDKRNVYTVLTKNNDAYYFEIISKSSSDNSDKSDWTQHVKGKVSASKNKAHKTIVLEELKKKCSAKTLFSIDEGSSISEEFISFGSRWRSLRRFSVNENDALVEVELNNALIADLQSFKLHPALLDVATGAVRLAAGGNYLPFSYGKLEIFKVLPSKIYGYIRFKDGYSSSDEIITTDIDVLDEKGELLAEINNFSMKHISEASAENLKEEQSYDAHKDYSTPIIKLIQGIINNRGGILQEGIKVSEGLKAFESIINGCFKSQVVVSSKDIQTALKQANYIAQPGVQDNLISTDTLRERHPRPELENDYVPAKNEAEKKLAGIWEEVLSIDKVGIHDEFFALGGDSLLLIQLHTKIKENFTTDIAVVDLYKYNTIALLSKYLIGSSKDEAPAFTEVNSRANRQIELMKKRRAQMLRGKGVTMNEQL